ncbi:fibronectin type III domain-containing protein [Francisellaceae bacterium]|nr:fibronectin type III domain-containing protein [Francisellaceae bacterium]
MKRKMSSILVTLGLMSCGEAIANNFPGSLDANAIAPEILKNCPKSVQIGFGYDSSKEGVGKCAQFRSVGGAKDTTDLRSMWVNGSENTTLAYGDYETRVSGSFIHSADRHERKRKNEATMSVGANTGIYSGSVKGSFAESAAHEDSHSGITANIFADKLRKVSAGTINDDEKKATRQAILNMSVDTDLPMIINDLNNPNVDLVTKLDRLNDFKNAYGTHFISSVLEGYRGQINITADQDTKADNSALSFGASVDASSPFVSGSSSYGHSEGEAKAIDGTKATMSMGVYPSNAEIETKLNNTYSALKDAVSTARSMAIDKNKTSIPDLPAPKVESVKPSDASIKKASEDKNAQKNMIIALDTAYKAYEDSKILIGKDGQAPSAKELAEYIKIIQEQISEKNIPKDKLYLFNSKQNDKYYKMVKLLENPPKKYSDFKEKMKTQEIQRHKTDVGNFQKFLSDKCYLPYVNHATFEEWHNDLTSKQLQEYHKIWNDAVENSSQKASMCIAEDKVASGLPVLNAKVPVNNNIDLAATNQRIVALSSYNKAYLNQMNANKGAQVNQSNSLMLSGTQDPAYGGAIFEFDITPWTDIFPELNMVTDTAIDQIAGKLYDLLDRAENIYSYLSTASNYSDGNLLFNGNVIGYEDEQYNLKKGAHTQLKSLMTKLNSGQKNYLTDVIDLKNQLLNAPAVPGTTLTFDGKDYYLYPTASPAPGIGNLDELEADLNNLLSVDDENQQSLIKAATHLYDLGLTNSAGSFPFVMSKSVYVNNKAEAIVNPDKSQNFKEGDKRFKYWKLLASNNGFKNIAGDSEAKIDIGWHRDDGSVIYTLSPSDFLTKYSGESDSFEGQVQDAYLSTTNPTEGVINQDRSILTMMPILTDHTRVLSYTPKNPYAGASSKPTHEYDYSQTAVDGVKNVLVTVVSNVLLARTKDVIQTGDGKSRIDYEAKITGSSKLNDHEFTRERMVALGRGDYYGNDKDKIEVKQVSTDGKDKSSQSAPLVDLYIYGDGFTRVVPVDRKANFCSQTYKYGKGCLINSRLPSHAELFEKVVNMSFWPDKYNPLKDIDSQQEMALVPYSKDKISKQTAEKISGRHLNFFYRPLPNSLGDYVFDALYSGKATPTTMEGKVQIPSNKPIVIFKDNKLDFTWPAATTSGGGSLEYEVKYKKKNSSDWNTLTNVLEEGVAYRKDDNVAIEDGNLPSERFILNNVEIPGLEEDKDYDIQVTAHEIISMLNEDDKVVLSETANYANATYEIHTKETSGEIIIDERVIRWVGFNFNYLIINNDTGEIRLMWSEAEVDDRDKIDGENIKYSVKYAVDNINGPYVPYGANGEIAKTNLTYLDMNLIPGHKYYFKIVAEYNGHEEVSEIQEVNLKSNTTIAWKSSDIEIRDKDISQNSFKVKWSKAILSNDDKVKYAVKYKKYGTDGYTTFKTFDSNGRNEVNGLEPGTKYTVKVTAYSAKDSSIAIDSVEESVTTLNAEKTPTLVWSNGNDGLKVTDSTDKSISLKWNSAVENNGDGKLVYSLKYGKSQSSLETHKFEGNKDYTEDRSIIIDGLDSGTDYYFQVIAHDLENSKVDAIESEVIKETTKKEQTVKHEITWNKGSDNYGLKGTSDVHSINLSWNAATLDGKGKLNYVVYKNDEVYGTTSETKLSVTGLTPSTQYRFSVEATAPNDQEVTVNPRTEVRDYTTLADIQPEPSEDVMSWKNNKNYDDGDVVEHNGSYYYVKGWAPAGSEPGVSAEWVSISKLEILKPSDHSPWESGKRYGTGEIVSFDGNVFQMIASGANNPDQPPVYGARDAVSGNGWNGVKYRIDGNKFL